MLLKKCFPRVYLPVKVLNNQIIAISLSFIWPNFRLCPQVKIVSSVPQYRATILLSFTTKQPP